MYKLNKAQIAFASFFAFIGLTIMLVAAFITVDAIKFKESALEVTATISDIQTEHRHRSGKRHGTTTVHHVYVDYNVNGTDYVHKPISVYTATMHIGKPITVYCNPLNPNEMQCGTAISSGLMIVFGVVFFAIGLLLIISEYRRKRYSDRLYWNGIYMLADDYVDEPANITVNNVRYHRLKVICHDEDGVEYEFYSRPYPPNKPPFTPGQPIKVYVDVKTDTTKYFVTS